MNVLLLLRGDDRRMKAALAMMRAEPMARFWAPDATHLNWIPLRTRHTAARRTCFLPYDI